MASGSATWSLERKTCLVTGATSGIGKETAVGLARLGSRVLIAGRDARKAEATRADIVRKSGNKRIGVLLADLSSLAEVRKLADSLLSTTPELHVLVNNAGVLHTEREVTVDGYEATFAVNHLAGFLLTNLLLDHLKQSAPARIVNVASDAHRFGAIDWDDLQSERAYRGSPLMAGMRVYGASKLANILFNAELARRLEGSGVTANCLHPGFVRSELGRNNTRLGERVVAALVRPFGKSAAKGAETSIHLAASPELEGVSGRYFANKRESSRLAATARDPDAARRLWDISCDLVGIERR